MITVVMVLMLAAALRQTCGVIIMTQQEMTAKLIRSKCQPETGASTEAIEGVLEGKFPDDRNLKCYMKCAMMMSLTMRDGKLRTDIALAMAEKQLGQETKDRVIAAIQKCSNADAVVTKHKTASFKCWTTGGHVTFSGFLKDQRKPDHEGLTDPCDIAFAATKCIHDADSEILLFP